MTFVAIGALRAKLCAVVVQPVNLSSDWTVYILGCQFVLL